MTGALAALALLLGSAPVVVADSSPLVTGHPNLVAAAAINPKAVLACFDQILSPAFTFTDANFFLQGYTESRKTGAPGLTLSSKTPTGGGKCVVAGFTGPGDARSFSTLVVLAGAVTASVPGGGGGGNVQSSVPLAAGTLPNAPGTTVRPQLALATVGGSSVAYTFNESLTAAGGTKTFGFYTATPGDTAFHAGTVTGFTPGATVTASFAGGDLTALPQASRFVVREGAVTDAYGETNPTGAIGGTTKRLNLAPTTGPTSGLTYRFDFDATIPVTAHACPAGFALFDASGVRYGVAAGTMPTVSGQSVTATMAPEVAGGDPAQITLATVAADALDGSSCAGGTAPLNSEGGFALPGTAAVAGLTSGPDLQSFTINRSTAIVSFVFDAPVAGAVNSGGFHLVDNSGSLTSPPSQASSCLLPPAQAPVFTVSPANQVNVNFSKPTCALLNLLPGPPDVSAVVRTIGVTVDEGAVSDAATGVFGPIGSLGITPTGVTGPTGPTTPPFTTVPVTPPAVTPATTKKPRVRKCRVITLHLLSTVSRNLRSATATVNGKKVAVSRKLTVTIDFSRYAGAKSVVVKIKGKLKNGHSTRTTKTYKNKC